MSSFYDNRCSKHFLIAHWIPFSLFEKSIYGLNLSLSFIFADLFTGRHSNLVSRGCFDYRITLLDSRRPVSLIRIGLFFTELTSHYPRRQEVGFIVRPAERMGNQGKNENFEARKLLPLSFNPRQEV